MDKKRIIKVDGVNYSLDTGEAIQTEKIKKPLLPTPSRATEELSVREEPIIHSPRKISHFDGIRSPAAKSVAKNQPTIAKAEPAIELPPSKPRATKNEPSPVKKNLATNRSEKPADNVGLSHPTLPMPTAVAKKRVVRPVESVFLHPFVQKVDRRITTLAMIRVVTSVRFWLMVAVPFVVVLVRDLTILSPNQLISSAKNLLLTFPYNFIMGAILFVTFLVSLSLYVSSQTAQIMTALKLKQLDHRRSSARFFLSQSNAKLFRTIAIRTIHLLLFWGSAVGLAVLIWYLYSVSQVYLETVKLPLLVLIALIGLVWLLLMGMRWPIGRAILAATDQTIGSIEKKSFSLIFGHTLKSLGIAVFWSLVSLLYLASIGAVEWSLSMYLLSDLSNTTKVILMAVGVGLIGFFSVVYTLWSTVFWASSYRALVSMRHTSDHLSDYLQIEHPSSRGKLVVTLFFVSVLLILIVAATVGYLHQDSVVATAKELARKLPASYSNMIPRTSK